MTAIVADAAMMIAMMMMVIGRLRLCWPELCFHEAIAIIAWNVVGTPPLPADQSVSNDDLNIT